MNDIEYDVAIAAYLIADLAQTDFDGLLHHVAHKELAVEGVALVTVDADGTVTVQENGDHLGRRGVELGGGVGLVVGLFSPPLLAAAAIGAAAGAWSPSSRSTRCRAVSETSSATPCRPARPGSWWSTTGRRRSSSPRASSARSGHPPRRSTAAESRTSRPPSPTLRRAWVAEGGRDVTDVQTRSGMESQRAAASIVRGPRPLTSGVLRGPTDDSVPAMVSTG